MRIPSITKHLWTEFFTCTKLLVSNSSKVQVPTSMMWTTKTFVQKRKFRKRKTMFVLQSDCSTVMPIYHIERGWSKPIWLLRIINPGNRTKRNIYAAYWIIEFIDRSATLHRWEYDAMGQSKSLLPSASTIWCSVFALATAFVWNKSKDVTFLLHNYFIQ